MIIPANGTPSFTEGFKKKNIEVDYPRVPFTIEEFKTEESPHILDSGDRTEFASGAVRDMREGKGRCDLLPLDVVANYINRTYMNWSDDRNKPGDVLIDISIFQKKGTIFFLENAIKKVENVMFNDTFTMLLEVAKHFEEGAKKYGDNNWRKGIPVRCYIDSSVRHYLKFLRGDKDEPHDRAFCWNILCAIWTCKHMPELNGYANEDSGEEASNETRTC